MNVHLLFLLKSSIYRIFASCVTSLITFIFTGSWSISILVGITEFISKIGAYFIFEELWKKTTELFFNSEKYRKNCNKFNKSGSVFWISGLNCAGKTTVAKELTKYVVNSVLLDGDAVRESINYDLGFTKEDIRTNLTKIANLANLLNDQGFNVIVSCISKNKNDRLFVKEKLNTDNYHEVYVHCSEEVRQKRLKKLHPDTKILQTDYEKSDYDVIEVDTTSDNIEKITEKILCKSMV